MMMSSKKPLTSGRSGANECAAYAIIGNNEVIVIGFMGKW
jgi:hypothetical protein